MTSEEREHIIEPDDERFVRHAGDEGEFPMGRAFACASSGIRESFDTQRNLKVHIAIAAAAIVLAAILPVPMWGWAAVIGCVALVISLELVNTAIESIVDLASPEWHQLAKTAKDCSAGAVLVAAIASVVIGCIVYIPAAVELAAIMIGG